MIERIREWSSRFQGNLYESELKEPLIIMQQGRILDVGTGQGQLLIKIAQKNPHLEAYGIDISEAVIEIAKKNAHDAGLLDKLQFQVGTVSKLSFEDNFFDLVISTYSLHHWTEPIVGLNEIHRVLKPRGEAWIYVPWRYRSKDAKDKLRNRYGGFISSLAWRLEFVPSTLTLNWTRELIDDPSLKFCKKQLERHGSLMLLKFQKGIV